MAWVISSAPYLRDRWESLPETKGEIYSLIQGDDLDFLRVLKAAVNWAPSSSSSELDYVNYFSICLAAHHATVGSYVPTDVDSKIRFHLWQNRNPDSVRIMGDLTRHALRWNLSEVTTGFSQFGNAGPVSGINGEILGILAGALAASVDHELATEAELIATTLDQELARQMSEVRAVLSLKEPEIPLLRLSTAIMHNLGDLNQGIKYWPADSRYDIWRNRYYRLGHESRGDFGRFCNLVGALVRGVMAPEGHRNYPLREVAALRRSRDFLFPVSPFLDQWGAVLGKHADLTQSERVEIVAALLKGIATLPGQRGYARALVGFFETYCGSIGDFEKQLPTKARATLKDSRVRQSLQTKRFSFESSLRTQARAIIVKCLSSAEVALGIEGFEH